MNKHNKKLEHYAKTAYELYEGYSKYKGDAERLRENNEQWLKNYRNYHAYCRRHKLEDMPDNPLAL